MSTRWSPCFECGKAAHIRYTCTECDAPLCPRHAYYYADEANGAITKNAKPKCNVHFFTEHLHPGILESKNPLLSGDFADRDVSRAMFTVELTGSGSRVVA
jgi:hypothetical protein